MIYQILKFKGLVIMLAGVVLISGCSENTPSAPEVTAANEKTPPAAPPKAAGLEAMEEDNQDNSQNDNQRAATGYDIDNTQYLFIAAEHSVEELQSLLQRADEIAQTSLDQFDQLDIAVVIHGANIDLFTQKNYEKNKQLIDLAAKLDAFEIMDFKICAASMNDYGVSREQVPSFIESVPYAPDEVKRLNEEGYINL